MKKKYLLLTASYWAWHNSAKEALKNNLIENNNEVLVIDFTDLWKYTGKISQKYYLFWSEEIPLLWRITFKFLDTYFVNSFLEKYYVNFFSDDFNQIIKDYSPDYIISTYPCWQYLVWDFLKQNKKTFNFWVVITDAKLSYPWYYKDSIIDKFYVLHAWIKEKLEYILPNRKNDIINSFFPIEAKYFTNKEKISNKKVAILLTWLDKVFTNNLLTELNSCDFYEEIIIIQGRNKKLFLQLKNDFLNKKYIFKDFLDIKEALKEIGIFITKPGWAIISECIAQDVFVISPQYIAGQEKWNIELLQEYKVGVYENDVWKIIQFLKYDYEKIDTKNFKNIKNADSIETIINSLQ